MKSKFIWTLPIYLFLVVTIVGIVHLTPKDRIQSLEDEVRAAEMDGMPTIIVVIPSNIEGNIVLTAKDGSTSIEDSTELYSNSYKRGWIEYWRRFKTGELQLSDHTAEPQHIQEYGIQSNGRNEGFTRCRLRLLESNR